MHHRSISEADSADATGSHRARDGTADLGARADRWAKRLLWVCCLAHWRGQQICPRVPSTSLHNLCSYLSLSAGPSIQCSLSPQSVSPLPSNVTSTGCKTRTMPFGMVFIALHKPMRLSYLQRGLSKLHIQDSSYFSSPQQSTRELEGRRAGLVQRLKAASRIMCLCEAEQNKEQAHLSKKL